MNTHVFILRRVSSASSTLHSMHISYIYTLQYFPMRNTERKSILGIRRITFLLRKVYTTQGTNPTHNEKHTHRYNLR